MILLAPGVENPAQQPVHKDNVHAPIGQRVLVLHVPVSRQHQVDPRLVPEPDKPFTHCYKRKQNFPLLLL